MKFNINYGSASNVGKVKEHNTDAVIDFPIANGHVFAVSDGHNGVEYGGALAAKITTEEIKRYFFDRSYANIANALTNAVSYANYCVHNQSRKEPKYNGIGSTLAILIIQNDEAYYASAGNSRIYISKKGQIARLTRDHVENGEVTVLLGKESNIKFSVCKNPIQLDGDEHFMLCTDGLTSQVSDDEILNVLTNNDMSSEYMTAQLIEKANAAGGTDNVSVQVIDFSDMTKKKNPQVSIWQTISVILLLLLITAGIYEFYKHKVNEGVTYTKKTTESVIEEMQIDANKAPAATAEQPNASTTPAKAAIPQAKTTADNTVTQPKQTASSNTQPSETIHLHIVEKGQNLFRIGLRYNVPLSRLEEMNGENASRLTIGAKLKIPIKAIHKVVQGETVAAIAAKYGSTEQDIRKANQLDSDELPDVGDELVIPLNKK